MITFFQLIVIEACPPIWTYYGNELLLDFSTSRTVACAFFDFGVASSRHMPLE